MNCWSTCRSTVPVRRLLTHCCWPAGVINPDSLRIHAGKPVAAICHGLWTIINADAARGRRMISWPSLEIDLRNAGAQWVDEQAVTDQAA